MFINCFIKVYPSSYSSELFYCIFYYDLFLRLFLGSFPGLAAKDCFISYFFFLSIVAIGFTYGFSMIGYIYFIYFPIYWGGMIG